ncbi:putative Poly(A) RNA polymerase protein [Podospora fimiseda]|uniref:polynucleotide adenylyltransferase n=1 Tax=Podospora fimiseda TaxID=252190 RepID=A0AAN7GUH5_9PEZI|nr:putative Poly(A) RNA polymerase protein [Podospora fimiseda]
MKVGLINPLGIFLRARLFFSGSHGCQAHISSCHPTRLLTLFRGQLISATLSRRLKQQQQLGVLAPLTSFNRQIWHSNLAALQRCIAGIRRCSIIMSYNSRHPPRGGGGGGHQQPPRDFRDRDRGYRDNRDSRDNYNNRARFTPSRHISSNSRPRYQNNRHDSYSDRDRPYELRSSVYSSSAQEPPPPPPSYNPPPPPPPPPAIDRYQMPQSEFTFRVDKPAGLQEADSYRPDQNGGRRQHWDRSNRGSRNGRRGGRFETKKPWRPFVAAERELLSTDHNVGEAEAFFDENAGQTFRALDELSDSDEAEMEISGGEDDDSTEPSHKRARLSADKSATEQSVPKWCNPDPYTALPTETSTTGKKKDVVQMIRKARIQSQEIRKSLSKDDVADFIALDFDSSDDASDIEIVDDSAPEPAPDVAVPRNDDISRRVNVPSLDLDLALGSRKRTHDDRIKAPHVMLKKGVRPAPRGGEITDEWRSVPHLTATPWIRGDHSQASNPLVWLHKEIVDFHDYIKPRDFEERLRADLVQEMKDFVKEMYKDADIYAFGSFPSGLYLPTGDMDLVLLSDKFRNRGVPMYATTSALFRFRDRLNQHQIPYQGDVELITKARVPLVKYVDRKTGLKVDVSFENSSGLEAIKTFLEWKHRYPGMPALVTLIKHFLMMRGLNEPANGGIGGFSVICLVVSMLQMSPEVQSGSLNTTHHLGELLIRFFDLYGNKFDYDKLAIRLFPPGYVNKAAIRELTYRQFNRISIIDPNNKWNDIAGGSSNTATIVQAFAGAHNQLLQRMRQIAEEPKHESILEVILGGNYTSFQEQRDYLESLFERNDIVPQYEEAAQSRGRGGHGRKRGRR